MVVKNENRRKKTLIIVAVVALAIAAGVVGFFAVKHFTQDKAELPVGGVNYDPPTSAEKKEAEEHKKELEEQANTTTSGANANATATVTITYLSVSETRGFVSGVVEEGGTCTLTLIKGSTKVTATSTAIDDVNKTTCGPISVDPSKLSSGEWDATLSYTSPTISGTSATTKLKVP